MNSCALWAYQVKGIGRKTLVAVQTAFGPGVFETLWRASRLEVQDLLEAAGIRRAKEAASCFVQGRERTPEELEAALERAGLAFVSLGEPDFPERLSRIPDPPFGLFYRGKLPAPAAPALAVIGSRDSTPYGRNLARRFAAELAAEGIAIISGMARGIDSISQTAALDAGGYSCAVLGSGADVCYPAGSRQLYEGLCARGGVVSEYLPGTQPRPELFPPRNRIVSGLADAVLVIEAGAKSGTMITAEAALEQGKDVFAVPGRPDDVKSRGCNGLIRQGALLAADPGDIVAYFFGGNERGDAAWCAADLRRERAKTVEKKRRADEMERSCVWVQESLPLDRTEEEKCADGGSFWSIVLSCLTPEGQRLPELLPIVREKAGRAVSVSELSRELTRLVLKGLAAEYRGLYTAKRQQEDEQGEER